MLLALRTCIIRVTFIGKFTLRQRQACLGYSNHIYI